MHIKKLNTLLKIILKYRMQLISKITKSIIKTVIGHNSSRFSIFYIKKEVKRQLP